MFFWLKSFLEDIDVYRDRLLFSFIKKYWPRAILPNHLTILRIVLAFLLIVLLLADFKNNIWLVTIFVFSALLDLFDGSIARALNKKTELGALLDSLADKILILPVAIYVLIADYFWLLIALVLPEIFNAVVVGYYRLKKVIVRPNIFGKTKMVLESVALAVIILFDFPGSASLFPIILLYLSFIFLISDSIIKLTKSGKQNA